MASSPSLYKFVHPGTIKQGYLIKSPPLEKRSPFDAWKKRWCVLTYSDNEPSLNYYHDEDESLSALPIKRVSLAECYKVESDLKHKLKRHVFALHLPHRVYYFSSPSHTEMVEWVDQLCAKLNLTCIDTRGRFMPATPPISRALHSDTLPAPSSPRVSPRSLPPLRPPDSPLPPIPCSSGPATFPRSPDFPTTDGRSSLSVGSSVSLSFPYSRESSAPNSRPSSATNREDHYYMQSLVPDAITVSFDRPPAPLPHANSKTTSNGNKELPDRRDEPPPPPPRRPSPVPFTTLSSPPLTPTFLMDGESIPPTPPPRVIREDGYAPHNITT